MISKNTDMVTIYIFSYLFHIISDIISQNGIYDMILYQVKFWDRRYDIISHFGEKIISYLYGGNKNVRAVNSIKLLTMRNNYWLKTASNKKLTQLLYHICSKLLLAHVLFCQDDLIANLELTIWVMTMIFWRYFPKPKIRR